MDWFASVDGYCERLDASFWAEPVNAITNAAFLIAALVAWLRTDARKDAGAVTLLGILVAIGIGSFLFHTIAQRWAALADTLPILLFILTYLYLATLRFLGLRWWGGALAVVLYFPFSIAVSWLVANTLGPLNGSVSYTPVVVALILYAALIFKRAPETANGLLYGAGILVLSLTFRTIDAGVCGSFPLGTHFLWHILNGTMLGWMIVVLLRHKRN